VIDDVWMELPRYALFYVRQLGLVLADVPSVADRMGTGRCASGRSNPLALEKGRQTALDSK